jgi:hypothetical protein
MISPMAKLELASPACVQLEENFRYSIHKKNKETILDEIEIFK